MKNSANLDVLRSIAVAFVVASHVPFYVPGLTSDFYSHKALGHLGVAMFFVHTTLVLMMSLERQGPAPIPFFIRRAFRIYPLAITVSLVVIGLAWLGGRPTNWTEVLSNILLIQNITGATALPSPLWTLPFEVQMYLVLPVVYVFAQRSPARAMALLAGALAIAAATGAWATMTLVSFAPCFLPGLLAFTLPRGRHSSMWLWGVIAMSALAVPVAAAQGIPETPMFWAVCLALGLTIPQCRDIGAGVVSRAGHTVATYSYGIYLTHVFAFALAFPNPAAFTLTQCVLFAVLLPGLAVLAYRAIEAPGIELGRRLSAAYSARISTARPAAIS